MGRALKHDIPGRDWRVDLETAAEVGVPQVFEPDLPSPRRLVVEIGYGRGEFLLDMAEQGPETAFLGIEYSFKRSVKMARRLARSEMQNVRLLCARAEDVLAKALRPASVDAFWINFPDPWPKARHEDRRFVKPNTIAQLVQRLVPSGSVYMATDDRPYAEQMHEVLSKEAGLENAYAPSSWLAEVEERRATAYELAWLAQGRPLHFFCYRRLPGEPLQEAAT